MYIPITDPSNNTIPTSASSDPNPILLSNYRALPVNFIKLIRKAITKLFSTITLRSIFRVKYANFETVIVERFPLLFLVDCANYVLYFEKR